MRVPIRLVFHQSKCISAIKRILLYYRHVYIVVFVNFFHEFVCSFHLTHVFLCSLLLRCMLKSSALRVGVKTLEIPWEKFLPVWKQSFVISGFKRSHITYQAFRSTPCLIRDQTQTAAGISSVFLSCLKEQRRFDVRKMHDSCFFLMEREIRTRTRAGQASSQASATHLNGGNLDFSFRWDMLVISSKSLKSVYHFFVIG